MAIKGWMAALAALTVGGAAYAMTRGPQSDPALRDDKLKVQVVRKKLVVEIVDTGRIAPREKVDIKSKVSGQVRHVQVIEGDDVKTGQLLLVLEPTDYERDVARAKAEVARAQNALDYAKLELKRKRKALAHRGVAEIEVALAENDLKAKSIAMDRAKIELSSALDKLRYTRVVAPLDGTVLELNIKKGEVVTPGIQQTLDGQPLLTIGDLSTLLVRCDLNQIDIARIRLEQSVELTFDAIPDQTFQARVTKIAPAAVKAKDQDVEMFPVEATLDVAPAAIKAGMTADVKFKVAEHDDVLTVPIEAVVKDKDGKAHVYVITDGADGPERTKTAVELGPRSDREQAIASGLKAGQFILIDPASAKDNEVEL